MKRKVIFIIVFALLAGLVGGFGYFQFFVKPEMIKGFILAGAPPPATVMAEEAKSGQWIARLPAIGTFRAAQGVDVAPETAGVVRLINFESGGEVEAGALLVNLDDSVEQADFKAGSAQLKDSERDLQRQRELLNKGNVSKAAFDAALARRDTAAAVIEHTKAVIAQKAIAAPFSGRLGIRKVDVGQYVSPGTPLVTLQQLNPIYVDFPLPEQEINALQTGQDVEVRVDAWPDSVFKGKIQSIDAKVNQETRNILVRAEFENPDKKLLPGMFASVNVLAGAAQNIVTVPRTAINYSLYGDSVYIVKDGVVERRFVRVGAVQGDRISITEGVSAGEAVVTSGQLKLQDKAHVVIESSAPLKPPAVRPKQ